MYARPGPRRGVEFVDLSTGGNYQNHWVRSGCLLGYLPCNGLLYVAPHPCECYINAKITGFNALAPKRRTSEVGIAKSERLEKGSADGQPLASDPRPLSSDEWPTYRHDSQRSGATDSAVSTLLEIAWRADIGTRPSGLVVAGGKVLVAGVDTHTVHALNADDGGKLWKYTAGARVDSPPTLYNGLAIFGSADGRVYCLRAADGVLVWRLDAGPRRRLVTAFGQLESPWPVPGSVLVHDGRRWFAAGRSSYLDGGIHFYALDPAMGKVLHSDTIYSPDSETAKMSPETDGRLMSGLLNDIPATDGASVFIRQIAISSSGARAGQHLYTTGGYLDPSWFNRTSSIREIPTAHGKAAREASWRPLPLTTARNLPSTSCRLHRSGTAWRPQADDCSSAPATGTSFVWVTVRGAGSALESCCAA